MSARSVAGWKALGWFGVVLTSVSLVDTALTWYPLQLGIPEWEFGTVAASYAGIPLLANGLAAMLVSAVALRRVWLVRATATLTILLALAMFAATAIFLLDVPIALRLAPVEISLAIKKTIVKTVVLGTVFPLAFLAAAIAAIRSNSRPQR